MHVTHVLPLDRLARALGLAALACLAGCETIIPPPKRVDLDGLADRLASYDVVFFGETHDNEAGHLHQLQLLRLMHERRPNLVLAMEMFERDVQPALDAYLAGETDEEAFLAESRPWPNYRKAYRPLIEYCKAHGLQVIASNVPTSIARDVARGASVEEIESPFAADYSRHPENAYWRAFRDAMSPQGDGGSHGELDDDTLEAFYRSQCLKDDTMAESIMLVLQKAELAGDERPFVLHLNGSFHTERRLGIIPRTAERVAGLRIGLVTMVDFDMIRPSGRDDFEMFVMREPKQSSAHEGGPPTAEPEVVDEPILTDEEIRDVEHEAEEEARAKDEEPPVDEPGSDEPAGGGQDRH